MKTTFRQIQFPGIVPLTVVIVLLLAFTPVPSIAFEDGVLWGRVLDPEGHPLPGVRVRITPETGGTSLVLSTDGEGVFRACGLPAGPFSAAFEYSGFLPRLEGRCHSDPSSILFLEVTLSPEHSDEEPPPLSRRFSQNTHSRTSLNRSDLENRPAGNNIWSYVENYDLSATTNRIDVGGFWLGHPALFSSRGSSSWTQNTYVFNGLDIGDPYWTGQPLFSPDLFSLSSTVLANAELPAAAFSPGAYFTLSTKSGEPEFHGGVLMFFSDQTLAASNITPFLENEGITESHTVKSLFDTHVYVSAPLLPRKLFLYASLTGQNLSRDLADYERMDSSSVSMGTLNLKYIKGRDELTALWSGQIVRHPSLGADRGVLFESTSDFRSRNSVFLLSWAKKFHESHILTSGLGYVRGRLDSDFQDGARTPHSREILRGTTWGAARQASEDSRDTLNAFADGQAFLSGPLRTQHLIRYGLRAQYAHSSSEKDILGNLHQLFLDGRPQEVVLFNTLLSHQESAFHVQAYAQDEVLISGLLTLKAGLHLGFSRGWVPGAGEENTTSWLNLSPRLGLSLALSRKSSSRLSLSAARYGFTMPLNYLTYGNPGAEGGLVYSWEDKNADFQYQAGEEGTLLRREGPFFSAIDPQVKRPYTDEVVLALILDPGAGWNITFAGFLRETRNLIETMNLGVPFTAYDPVEIHEVGDDLIPGSHDDLTFTVYNRRPEFLGQDFFLLTNVEAGKRISRYRGADITLVKRHGRNFTFFFSFQAIEAIGTANPGNTEWENDDGVVGILYDDPNTLISAKGRLRYDRGFTARLGFTFRAPWGFRGAAVVKYYDGQPFARRIPVLGFNQGPFFIMAHTRGIARYEFNMTVDIRVEKTISLGRARLRLILDGFNVFNQNLATAEYDWPGQEFFLRYPTEIQSPRVLRLGLGFDF